MVCIKLNEWLIILIWFAMLIKLIYFLAIIFCTLVAYLNLRLLEEARLISLILMIKMDQLLINQMFIFVYVFSLFSHVYASFLVLDLILQHMLLTLKIIKFVEFLQKKILLFLSVSSLSIWFLCWFYFLISFHFNYFFLFL